MWTPGAREALTILRRHELRVSIITNQACVGKGLGTQDDLEKIHTNLKSDVEAEGGLVSGIYVCQHIPDDACDCRKPMPGLLTKAMRDYGIKANNVIFIGDSATDMLAGKRAGCKIVQVDAYVKGEGYRTTFSSDEDSVAGLHVHTLLDAVRGLVEYC